MHRPPPFSCLAALAAIIVCLYCSDTGAATQLRKSVLASGATDTYGGGYRVRGTVGQHTVGTSYLNLPEAVNIGYWFDPFADAPTAVGPGLPTLVYALHPNRPNPFNPSTTIRFTLPAAMRATIRLYDVAGRQVATVADGRFERGVNDVPFQAGGLASGVYFCRLVAGSFSATQKIVLLK